jgi:phosphoesterase RecJ-like protein
MLLTDRMLKESGAILEDADGFVEYPRDLAGVELAVLFRINGRGSTRVSLRSRSLVNARAIAMEFGGGGHRQAAAYTDSSSDPAVALKRFLEKVGDFESGVARS